MKNLRVIELCSGIGAQVKGIERTGLFQVESVATADLDKEVVVSYAAMHCGLTNELIENYENYPSKEKMIAELTAKRLGYDFKNDKPYDWCKLARKKDKIKGIEKYWLADHLSHNLGDMMKVESLPDCDFLSYSTPCQSLSIAGHQDGLKWTCQTCGTEYDPATLSVEDRYTCPNCGSHHIKSTRSGLLYEVERLLVTAKNNGNLPKYLLMENVDALVSKKFIDSFHDWLERLDNLGYNSYYQVINAKNVGIPQNRKRIFVISILKEIDTGKFTFPVPFDNGIRLKDVLEETVDEHYYLSDEKVEKFLENLIKTNDNKSIFIKQATKQGYIECNLPGVADLSFPESHTRRGRVQENGTISPTLTATQTGISKIETHQCIQLGNYYPDSENYKNRQCGRVYSAEGCAPTLNTCGGGDHEPKIVCGVDKSNNNPQIIERANCITTREDRGISNHKAEGTAIIEAAGTAVIECLGNINPSGKGMNGNVFTENGLSPTLTTNKGEGLKVAVTEPNCNYELNGYPIIPDQNGYVQTIVAMRGRNPENPSDRTVGVKTEQRLEVNTTGSTNCITTVQKDNLVLEGKPPVRIRIRKLTPKECHRLMGFDDIDVDRCKAVGMSDGQGYKQSGNSIVTNVISLLAEHLYKAQFDETYECLDEKITKQK